jgi:hypothetical protein
MNRFVSNNAKKSLITEKIFVSRDGLSSIQSLQTGRILSVTLLWKIEDGMKACD